MRLIDADAIYPWYMDAFDFDPNEVRFSMNDIRDNLDNIPTQKELCEHYTPTKSVDHPHMNFVIEELQKLPSAQPEQHTCVNCGRTVNNGGWYADGRTRCPIEEHYALPKDGYCHLWEKRNVTDDDYPERREE